MSAKKATLKTVPSGQRQMTVERRVTRIVKRPRCLIAKANGTQCSNSADTTITVDGEKNVAVCTTHRLAAGWAS